MFFSDYGDGVKVVMPAAGGTFCWGVTDRDSKALTKERVRSFQGCSALQMNHL
jgi:hypothetical protein